jgi:predicted dehydrogenase
MLRVGLIGAGWVTRQHLIGWNALAGRAKVVAVADPSSENAARRAEEFHIPAVYSNAEAMLKAEKLDALDIASPREFHTEHIRLGAAYGLAILCQKPLAPDLAQAEALIGAVNGVRLMVHENWRFRQYYRDAASWLAEGRVGTVQQCTMTLLASGLIPNAEGVRPALERQPFFKTLTRMLVSEVLIHQLDTLRVLLGPLQVRAARLGQSCPIVQGEDNALIYLTTQSGAAVTLLGNLCAAGYPAALTDELTVVGDTGTLRLNGPVLDCVGPKPIRNEYDLAACYQSSYSAAIAHFVDSVISGAPFETSPADNLETLRLVEDCYRLSGRA